MKLNLVRRVMVAIALPTMLAAPAFAQYGGSTTGSGGYSSSKGVAIGAGAAAGAVAMTFLYFHYHGTVQGCVTAAGPDLQLVDNQRHKTYTLDAGGLSLQPGQTVKLRGKKVKGKSGAMVFQAHKLVRVLGTCEVKGSSLQPRGQPSPAAAWSIEKPSRHAALADENH